MMHYRIGLDARHVYRQRAGIGQYTYNLIKHVTRLEKHASFFLFVDTTPKETLDARHITIRKLGIDLKGFNWPRKFYSPFWMNFLLPKYINKQIDIFHSPNYLLPLSICCRSVVTVHDLIFLKYPETYDFLYPRYLKLLVPKSLQKADKIIAVSKTTRNDLLEWLDIEEKKISVIYNGIGGEFVPIEDKGLLEQKAQELNLPNDFLLYVGTVESRKNLAVLLYAFRELKTKHQIPHKLLLVGKKGQGWQEIRNLPSKIGVENDVIFRGYVRTEDLVYLYNLADVFIYPSIYEGFGIPVFEAIACGTPVVASNTSSIAELAQGCARLVNSGSSEEFASGVSILLSNMEVRKKLLDAGMSRVKTLTWENSARQVQRLYHELLQI